MSDIFFFFGLAVTASLRLGKLGAAVAEAASRSSASTRSDSAAHAPMEPHGFDIFGESLR